jgi:pimeloyl-ACP methyl ester carboxylesterase
MSRNAHAKSGVGPTMDLVPTPVGTAGVTWYPALGSVRAVALLGHGSPAELLTTGRPTLVIQGSRDPFGRPGQFPALPPEIELVEIPDANHTFGTTDATPRSATMDLITDATSRWIERQLLKR